MNILALIDGMNEEEIGKMFLGETNSFICEKAKKLLDGLMKDEIIDFFAEAPNEIEGFNSKLKRLTAVFFPVHEQEERDM